MKTDTIWVKMVKIENEFKEKFIADKELFTEVLDYAKETDLEKYKELVKLYEEYYDDDEKFWIEVEDDNK